MVQERLLGKRQTGDRVDSLMIGVDPATGATVPCTAHATIVSYLQQELEHLGHEKGAGANAYASTSAFHRVLFNTSNDMWGNTILRTKTKQDMCEARSSVISDLTPLHYRLQPLDWKETAEAAADIRLTSHFFASETTKCAFQYRDLDDSAKRQAEFLFLRASPSSQDPAKQQDLAFCHAIRHSPSVQGASLVGERSSCFEVLAAHHILAWKSDVLTEASLICDMLNKHCNGIRETLT